MIDVEYSHNNSGGRDWLDESDWLALEAHGWEIEWWDADAKPRRGYTANRKGALSIDVAVAEWQAITGQWADDEGCPCCGSPHSFSGKDDSGRYVWR